jgi:hypothetical protein
MFRKEVAKKQYLKLKCGSFATISLLSKTTGAGPADSNG